MSRAVLNRTVPEAVPSTQQRLLAAARKVFSQNGLAAATTKEIAKEAHVNEVTLFRHFVSKDRLLIAVLDSIAEDQRNGLKNIELSMNDVEQDLLQLAGLYLKTFHEHERLIRILLAEGHTLGEPLRKQMAQRERPLSDCLRKYIAEAQRRKLLKAFPVDSAADALMGMLASMLLKRSMCEPAYSADEHMRTCVSIFLNGMKA
jgi:AcrR family transcriptional regulator